MALTRVAARSLPLLMAALLAGCRAPAPAGPVEASVIGARLPLSRIGLVRLDAAGQVLPALALRWAILEGGRDYLFRIDDMPGRPSAAAIARRLRAILTARRARRDALPVVEASVTAVTPTVIEMRLASPQPDLLLLLARRPFGLETDRTTRSVIARAERVGRAVARFRAGATAFVTGGTFADLPVAEVAGLDPQLIRFDPATGLFGFAPADGGAPVDAALLRALDLALDRIAIVRDIRAPGLVAATPRANDGAEEAADRRLAEARALVARHGDLATPLRVAMPSGPGARLLFAHAAADWRRIGVAAVAVPADAPADLVLIDRVVPAGSVPLLTCLVSAPCDPRDPAALAAPPFLAIATPVRWSLVGEHLAGFVANPLAAHPLAELTLTR